MQKDILGQKDLDFLKIDWCFHGPGMMEGRCAATGTCDSQPRPIVVRSHREPIESTRELIDPKEVLFRYGSLFSE
jgi:hypothetical protein